MTYPSFGEVLELWSPPSNTTSNICLSSHLRSTFQILSHDHNQDKIDHSIVEEAQRQQYKSLRRR